MSILRGLSATVRGVVMTMLRALGRPPGSPPPPVASEQPDVLVTELLEEFRRVPDEWKPEIVNQARMFRRMAEQPAPHIIGNEDEEERARATKEP